MPNLPRISLSVGLGRLQRHDVRLAAADQVAGEDEDVGEGEPVRLAVLPRGFAVADDGDRVAFLDDAFDVQRRLADELGLVDLGVVVRLARECGVAGEVPDDVIVSSCCGALAASIAAIRPRRRNPIDDLDILPEIFRTINDTDASRDVNG